MAPIDELLDLQPVNADPDQQTVDAWLDDLDSQLLPPPLCASVDAFGEARRVRAIDDLLMQHPAAELPDALPFVLMPDTSRVR